MRIYPTSPVVSVGAVILDGDRVVLVKRGQAPLKGRWSLPGGVVELGESLGEALAREVTEETGLKIEVGPVVDVLDRIEPSSDGRIEFHTSIDGRQFRIDHGDVLHIMDLSHDGYCGISPIAMARVPFRSDPTFPPVGRSRSRPTCSTPRTTA